MAEHDERPSIAEVIVVEGRDDVTAVKRAVQAEVLTTGGFGFPGQALATIVAAHRRRGIIVLTDPDSAGNWIRRRIVEAVGDCKQAHLPQTLCQQGSDIGVEHAPPDAIRQALQHARATRYEPLNPEFTMADLIRCRLTGVAGSAQRRRWLGERLSLGVVNARQLLRRLNGYGVTRAEFEASMDALELLEKGHPGEPTDGPGETLA